MSGKKLGAAATAAGPDAGAHREDVDTGHETRHATRNGRDRRASPMDAEAAPMAATSDNENGQLPESYAPPHHVAARRISAMATNMRLSLSVGAALPLLQHIILQCGGGNECVLLLTDLASACDTPHPTLRSWLKKLADAGLIEKAAAGCEGLHISLSDSLLRQINPSAMESPLAGLVQKAAATQVVLSSMFEQLIADLKRGGIAG